ncbi:hypothetical protein C8T65DRAFT_833641 [Cerioporus squamosus]|nr:hypothetical protein C8T65DRAFT_833641 [Cerioporus squamosus]
MYPDFYRREHPDDEYLFEFDLDEKGRMQFDTDGTSAKFTDRAKAAQEAKWRRLNAIFGPRKALKKSMMGSRGGNPPRLAYGWVYKREFIWDYATHHNLEMDVSDDAWFTELAGTTLIKYGELTEEQKSNEKLVSGLKTLARLLVLEDLSEKAGIQLVRVCPFSYDWPWMFELFNNYNVEERTYEMEEVSGSVQKVVDVVQEAMAVGDHKPELLWWYDWEHLQVKWTRLSAIFGPRKMLKRSMMGSRGGTPLRLAYGWAYNREFVWDYATHHNLELDAFDDEWLSELAGTTSIKCGELTEEQKSNDELISALKTLAHILVFLKDLSTRAGIKLERVTHFACGYVRMFAIYNNCNIEERTYEMEEVSGSVQNVVDVVEEAMTIGDHKPELLWWYDWEHLTVRRIVASGLLRSHVYLNSPYFLCYTGSTILVSFSFSFSLRLS